MHDPMTLPAGWPLAELVRRTTRDCATQHAGARVLDGKRAGFVSYKDLVDDAARRAHALVVDQGVAVGDRVLLAFQTSHAFISSFLAVQIAGGVPVPVPRPQGLSAKAEALRLTSIVASSGARLLLSDEAWAPELVPPQVAAGRLAFVVVDGAAAPGPRLATRPQATSFVQYTSGSTAEPRGVVVDVDAAVAQFTSLARALGATRHDVGVCWLPMFHDMGLVGGLLMPMVAGFDIVFMQPSSFLRRPGRWLQAIAEHRGTISAAPTSAYALAVQRVRDDERNGLDLRSWRVALHGAEPVREAAVRAFEAHFAPAGFAATSTMPAYGLAEATLAVSAAPVGSGARFVDDGVVRGCVIGPAIAGAQVSLADDGEIIVDAPFVAAGYLHDAAATARTFAPSPHAGLRRLFTGDYGAFVDDGAHLVVVGRKKDVIITRGKKVAAEDVEHIVESLPPVRAHSALAFAVPSELSAGEGVVVMLALHADHKDTSTVSLRDSVRTAVGEALGVNVVDVCVVRAGDLPRTTSGKKQRAAAALLWRAQQTGGPP